MRIRLQQSARKICPNITGMLRLCLLLSTLTACLPPTLPSVVKIGLIAPFEGSERDRGYDAIYAARMAIREINASGGAGGVGGWQLELIAYDDRADPEFAQTAARNLATDDNVVAVIGHFYPDSTAAAESVYVEAGLPLLAFDATDPSYPLPETLPGTGAWIESYRASGPHTPAPDVYALPTYEAVMALAEAITAATTQGQPTRAAIAAALPNVERQGPLGTLRWQTGDNGIFQLLRNVEPNSAPHP
ncbi:MAG: Leucine-, isoleucine-, valine-, threonine-, and alanine-binding protein precursor [Chloroflexi bacterium ADurb.Bin360]|nr:MAG: Leucine-, isoleucine-, valine-, threonine-, and alanine-binding protein precursor [Chloroflexi bacterium ADurb.Bin360]